MRNENSTTAWLDGLFMLCILVGAIFASCATPMTALVALVFMGAAYGFGKAARSHER